MAASSQIQSADRFASGEAETVGSYRSPSALAVASLLVGLCSPVYVLGSLLVVVPLVGIALALLALRRIADSDGALFGRSLAVVGLVLSITSAAAVVSYSMVTRQLRSAQAVDVGKEWISLVLAGDTVSAYQLATGSPPPDPDQPQDFGPEGNPYHRFVEHVTVQKLLSLRGKGEIRDEGTVRYGALGDGVFIVHLRYTVIPDPTASDSVGEFTFLLQVRRTQIPGMRGMLWRARPFDEES
jgi:hypothetical protein